VSIYSQDAAWLALAERAERAQSDQSRTISAFANAFEYFQSAGSFGFGAGSATFGAPGLAKDKEPFSWLPFGHAFEEESGRIVIELGVVGWVISLTMRAVFAVWAGLLALRGASPGVRMAAVLALPMMAMGLYQGNGVFAPPVAGAFYWLCIAILAMAQAEHQFVLRPLKVEAHQNVPLPSH
jgi:hypothetical protein